jgi:hypothetical protein
MKMAGRNIESYVRVHGPIGAKLFEVLQKKSSAARQHQREVAQLKQRIAELEARQ